MHQASTCGNLSLVAKLVTMIWSNSLHSLRMPDLVSNRNASTHPHGPIVLILPPATSSSAADSLRGIYDART